MKKDEYKEKLIELASRTKQLVSAPDMDEVFVIEKGKDMELCSGMSAAEVQSVCNNSFVESVECDNSIYLLIANLAARLQELEISAKATFWFSKCPHCFGQIKVEKD